MCSSAPVGFRVNIVPLCFHGQGATPVSNTVLTTASDRPFLPTVHASTSLCCVGLAERCMQSWQLSDKQHQCKTYTPLRNVGLKGGEACPHSGGQTADKPECLRLAGSNNNSRFAHSSACRYVSYQVCAQQECVYSVAHQMNLVRADGSSVYTTCHQFSACNEGGHFSPCTPCTLQSPPEYVNFHRTRNKEKK